MHGKVFLDTNPFIYLVGEISPFYNKVLDYIAFGMEKSAKFYTSTITDAEFFVKPFADRDFVQMENYQTYLKRMGFIKVNINEQIAKRAALIRSIHKAIKLGDALQLGACIEYGCDVFLTNDGQLRQVKEVNVMYIGDL